MSIGFYSAVSGMEAAQRQLDTSSHNVANANTAGYSRQVVAQQASTADGFNGAYDGQTGTGGAIGTGVTVESITRVRDQFIDASVRSESSTLGQQSVTADQMQAIQSVFGEPSTNGIGAQVTQFFNDWQELSTNPSDDAVRTSLRQDATNLTQTIQSTYQQLQALRQSANDSVNADVDSINTLSTQIASLNHQIKASLAAGQSPNDLLDQQDQLIDQLSSKVSINVVASPTTGARSVFIGGQPLVNDENAYKLGTSISQANGITTVTFAPTGAPANITGGELKGLMDIRDKTLSDTDPNGVITQLNALTSGLMASVNALHSTGFGPTGVTGQTFFDGTNASDITVNANIVNDTALANGVDVIAAAANDPGSLTGGVGDAQIASQIGQLANSTVMTNGTQTFSDYYKNLITTIANQTQQSTNNTTSQTAVVNSIKERRDSVSGVSTDEEMANVVRFQNAYAASARIITTYQTILDTLVHLGEN